jgi:hypothetical protein
MITNELPKLTRVVIIYSNDGYFLKREKSDEILDIRFNTPKEAIDYARANRLFIIVRDNGRKWPIFAQSDPDRYFSKG